MTVSEAASDIITPRHRRLLHQFKQAGTVETEIRKIIIPLPHGQKMKTQANISRAVNLEIDPNYIST